MNAGPSPRRVVARVRSGRARRRYQTVLDCHRTLVGTLDRAAIRQSVEQHGLVTRDDPTLFELNCTFMILDSLTAMGWHLERLGFFEGALKLTGHRNSEQLELAYQHTPKLLSRGSVYRKIQQTHGLPVGGLRPDLVLRYLPHSGEERWLVIEVKGGKRSVQKSARAAAYDLLAYKTAYSTALAASKRPYGLGIAWGAGLEPAVNDDPFILCTPDTLAHALKRFFVE